MRNLEMDESVGRMGTDRCGRVVVDVGWRRRVSGSREVRGLNVLILAGEARWVDPTLQAQFQYRIGLV